MLFIRSLAFNAAFYAYLVVIMLISLPLFLLPQRFGWWLPRFWAHGSLWLLKHIAGINLEIRGGENKDRNGVLIASKHQSFWETFALTIITHKAANIAKKELGYIPVFGWYMKKFDQITIDRGRGMSALKSLLPQAKRVVDAGRDVIIFPEGTRRPPGASPAYKHGVSALYRHLDVPVIPIALNAGLYWPRRTFLRYPGTIVIEVLPAIEPGLPDKEFRERLIRATEDASERLLNEARAKGEGKPADQ